LPGDCYCEIQNVNRTGTIELPVLPDEAVILSPRLAVVETAEELVFMKACGPLMSCRRCDKKAVRYIGAILMSQGLAKGKELAPVLKMHRSTLFRNQKLYRGGAGFASPGASV
jgi:hypothetical protein